MAKQTYKYPSRYYTPRPVFSSEKIEEENFYNEMCHYIYAVMDKEYRKVLDTEEGIEAKDIKFVAYISLDIVGRFRGVAGYNDFNTKPCGGITFSGHEVVIVNGKKSYVHFVRTF